VAVRTLLRVEVIWRNNEHVVALYADAVQRFLGRVRRIGRPVRFVCLLSFAHKRILPH
jgi:hypothetical protein